MGAYWTLTSAALLARLDSTATGLTSTEAAARLGRHGPNTLMARGDPSRFTVLGRQLASPLLLLLLFAGAASAVSGEWLDAAMVVTIVVATVAIGYSREYGAATAARALRERVRVQATVLRDGLPVPTAVEAVVPGDVVLLAAGSLAPPEAEFDRGIRRFGYLLTGAMLIVTLLVFVAHVVRGRPPIDTLLFAIALAAGLSPELLPAILSVNLARGAQMMARQGVLVRRLNAIENLGSAHVLCTDKTCTLTEGVVRVEGASSGDGHRRRASWSSPRSTPPWRRASQARWTTRF